MATEVAEDVPVENGPEEGGGDGGGLTCADVALSVAVAVGKIKAHHDDCKPGVANLF